MSQIIFEASLNTEKLEAAIKQSNQKIGEWVKGVENAGGVIDKVFEHTSKSIKQAISDQKTLIKSIEQDVKRLQKVYDDATAGQAKSNAGGEVGSAKRALREEQARLGGLQKEQIKLNEQEGSTIGGLVGKIGAWGAGLFTVGAALKITKAIINSTEGTTHAFEVAVAQVTSGIGYLFKSIASGDWSNFTGGLREAVKGAKEFTDAMEEVERLKNQEKMVSSDIQKSIAADLELTYDRSDANNKEAIAAYDRIITNTELQFTAKIEAAQKEFDTALAKASTDTGGKVSKDEILDITKNYKSIKDVYELGQKWKTDFALMREEADKIQFSEGKSDKWKAASEKIKAAQAAAPIAEKIDLVTFDAMDSIANLYKTLGDLEAAKQSGNKLFKRRQAALVNEEIKIAEDAAKKAIEDAKTENQIKIQTELLNKAIESGNAVEIKAIGERIRKLQEELVVRQRIAEAAIATSMTREGLIPKITGLKAPIFLPGGLKVPNTLAGKPTFDSGDYIAGTAMLTDQGKANQKKKSDQTIADILAADEERKKNQQELIKGASELVYLAGKQLGLSEDELKVLDDKLQVIGQFASGNIVGAAVTTAMSIISGFMSLIPDNAAKFAAQVEHLNRLLEVQQRLIDQSARTGFGAETREEKTARLEAIKAAQEAELKKAQDYLNPNKFKLFRTQAGMKQAAKDVADLTIAIENSDYAILQAGQDLDDFLTGGITGNTIADVIKQSFAEGKTSVDDFAVYMNDVLNNAVLQIFTDSLLSSDKMKSYLVWLKEAMSGGITPEEAKQNAQWVADIAAENKAMYESMTSGLKVGNTSQSGLSGIVRNMSEDTGNEMTGILRNQRDDIRQVRDYSKLGIDHMMQISANTYGSWQELITANKNLEKAVTNLETISGNTKQNLEGVL